MTSIDGQAVEVNGIPSVVIPLALFEAMAACYYGVGPKKAEKGRVIPPRVMPPPPPDPRDEEEEDIPRKVSPQQLEMMRRAAEGGGFPGIMVPRGAAKADRSEDAR